MESRVIKRERYSIGPKSDFTNLIYEQIRLINVAAKSCHSIVIPQVNDNLDNGFLELVWSMPVDFKPLAEIKWEMGLKLDILLTVADILNNNHLSSKLSFMMTMHDNIFINTKTGDIKIINYGFVDWDLLCSSTENCTVGRTNVYPPEMANARSTTRQNVLFDAGE